MEGSLWEIFSATCCMDLVHSPIFPVWSIKVLIRRQIKPLGKQAGSMEDPNTELVGKGKPSREQCKVQVSFEGQKKKITMIAHTRNPGH
jgi:hypothetical protein